MSITLYHFPQSRSLRVAWLLEEMGLDHNLKTIPRDEARQYAKTEEYRAINPLGKFPTLVDGDQTIVESVAIMQYLMAKYEAGSLQPDPGSDAYAAFLQWLHFGESGMGTYVVMLLGHSFLLPEEHRVQTVAAWGRAESYKCLDFLSQGLGEKEHLCPTGFTAADISVFYMLFLLKLMRQFDDAPGNLKAYFDRLKMRPAWQKVSAIEH